MGTDTLLVIFKDTLVDERRDVVCKRISGVSSYGWEANMGVFHFTKNNRKSYFPKENIIFFGPAFDWEVND